MATKITLVCDWCKQVPQWMNEPARQFLYRMDLKFVQCESKYELCSRECMYALMQSLLNKDANDNAK